MLILEELVAQKITQKTLVEVISIQGELVAQIITQEPLVEVILIQGELVAQIIIQEIQGEAMPILEEKMPFPCQIANPLCIILYQQLLRAFLQVEKILSMPLKDRIGSHYILAVFFSYLKDKY